MASLRILIVATTPDAISTRNIRIIDELSVVNLWASSVAIGDTIGMDLGRTSIMDQSTMNVHAAALGLVHSDADQLVFNALVGPGGGDLQIPIDTVGTSLIFLLSVEPLA